MTIKDIARQAGVSTATVSYVMNGSKPVTPEKRQRVLDIIAMTDYKPNQVAKSLRTKKTNIWIYSSQDDLPEAGRHRRVRR